MLVLTGARPRHTQTNTLINSVLCSLLWVRFAADFHWSNEWNQTILKRFLFNLIVQFLGQRVLLVLSFRSLYEIWRSELDRRNELNVSTLNGFGIKLNFMTVFGWSRRRGFRGDLKFVSSMFQLVALVWWLWFGAIYVRPHRKPFERIPFFLFSFSMVLYDIFDWIVNAETL